MLRKVTATCVILATAAASATVLADTCTGGYIGAGVGMIDNLYKSSGSAAGDNFSQSAGGRGFNGTVFGGYGYKPQDRYYVGAEIHGSYSNNKVNIITLTDTLDGSSAAVSVKQRYSYGLSIIPGVILGPDLLGFFRIGIVDTRFDVNASADGVSVSSNKYVVGGEFGAGIQAKISENVSLRGEYVYTTYKSFSAVTLNFIPSSDQINLGLVFAFG